MSYGKSKTDYGALLKTVLPEYKLISEAKDSDPVGTLFKSIDYLTGVVYLIADPNKWEMRKDPNGRCTMIRPMPINKGHISDLPKGGSALPSISWEA